MKLNRDIFTNDLEKNINSIFKELDPGIVQILSDNFPYPKLRKYESNYIFFNALENQSWWTVSNNTYDNILAIPCDIIQNKSYQAQKIFQYEKYPSYEYIIRLELNDYNGINIIKNVLRFNDDRKIKILSFNKKNIINKNVCI